jgi:uncharacterized membrane protein
MASITDDSRLHELTPEDRQKGLKQALSEESRRKRRDTWARYRAEDKEAVRILRQQGLVPLAIGPELNMPDSTVAKHLRELEREGLIDPIPRYLTLTAPAKSAAE